MLATLVALTLPADAHIPVIYITSSTEDWCAVINGTIGNDIVMLLPGVYEGPCDIVAKLSDVPAEITVVQSFDPVDPAVFHAGAADYVLSASGERLLLMQIEFSDIGEGVDVVRFGSMVELWTRFCWFRRIAGTAIVQRGDVESLRIAESEFTDVGVAAQIGCPDGSCSPLAFETWENLITRSSVGFLVSPGTPGSMRDDVIVETPTAIRLMGAGPGRDVEVSGGLYQGTGPVIDVVGGPALFTSNVVIGAETAIRAAGDAVTDVRLVGNTVIGGEGTALDLTGWSGGRGLRLVDMAIDQALPSLAGVEMDGSIACPDPSVCFTDPAAWDFYPTADSPLRNAGVVDDELKSDWCGRVRQDPPTAGALEGFGELSFGGLAADYKEAVDCTLPEGPTETTDAGTTDDSGTTTGGDTDTGTEENTDGSQTPTPEPSCGCNAARGTWGMTIGLPLLTVLLRRRRFGPHSSSPCRSTRRKFQSFTP